MEEVKKRKGIFSDVLVNPELLSSNMVTDDIVEGHSLPLVLDHALDGEWVYYMSCTSAQETFLSAFLSIHPSILEVFACMCICAHVTFSFLFCRCCKTFIEILKAKCLLQSKCSIKKNGISSIKVASPYIFGNTIALLCVILL